MTTVQRSFYFIFALLFAAGMHYYQYNYGGVGLTAPFNLMTWGFVSILIGLGLWHCSQNGEIYYSPLLVATSLFVASLFIPILYSNNELLIHSTQRLIGLTAGLAFLFSLYQINLPVEKWHKLIPWIQVGIIIEGGICFTQQYVFPDTVWMQHNPNLRPSGIFQQPNVISTFAVMGIALATFNLAFNKHTSKIEQYIINLAGLVAAWIIMLNTSRTATIALFIVLIGTAPLLYRQANRAHLRHWYYAILLGLAIPLILNLMDSTFKPREIVENIRPTLYFISLGLIAKNLLTGVGYGGFSVNFHQAQAEYIETHEFSKEQFANNAAHPHNEVLLWGVEGGLLPLISFVILFIFVGYRYLALGWRKGIFYLSIIFPAAFHSMTELPFYHAAIVFITFTFTAYMIEKSAFIEKKTTLPQALNFKLTALIIPALTLCFTLTGLHTLNRLRHFQQTGHSDMTYLQEIINPIAISETIDYAWLTSPLLTNRQNTESIERFIAATEQKLNYWPRARLYQDLATAYQLQGNQERANSVYREGKRLFPFNQKFNSIEDNLIELSTP
ncbi:O-antigen polymerase [Shewanella sp. MR-4]|uniref:PglL family O-oligosaccharyltransferase n=1 Tax=Shewanella sp. (strain MR-4) TaxID=60480 RepID=UPI00005E5B24|nr:Wzy polymerase domain-containing protein [Shewanella sp. MR-4]ABI37503.1 O-antigen polymerase [Shewanella sp. MR-4]